MDLINLLGIMGAISVATLFGSMAFFTCVVAPLVFIELDAATAGRFIRLFLVLCRCRRPLANCSAFVCSDTSDRCSDYGLCAYRCLFLPRILMPRINRQRDAMVQGNDDAEIPFNRLHRSSVLINTLELSPFSASWSGC